MTPNIQPLAGAHRQRGVVLFVALIAMLLLSLAGIALMRSVDTTLGDRRQPRLSATPPSPRSTRRSSSRSWTCSRPRPPVVATADDFAHNYFVAAPAERIQGRRPGAAPGRLHVDEGGLRGQVHLGALQRRHQRHRAPLGGRAHVQRAGRPEPEVIGHCDILPPKVPSAGTDNKCVVKGSCLSCRPFLFSASPFARTSSTPTPCRTHRPSSNEGRFDCRGVRHVSVQPIRRRATRALCALLAFAMTFAPVTAAYAAPTPLADVPIAAKVTAKPNIVYTLDDSGSMQYNYLPDYVVNAAANVSVSLTRIGPVRANTARDECQRGAGHHRRRRLGQRDRRQPARVQRVLPGHQQVHVPIRSNSRSRGRDSGHHRGGLRQHPDRHERRVLPQRQRHRHVSPAGRVHRVLRQHGIAGSTITRVGPLTTGGLVTATATGTAANLAHAQQRRHHPHPEQHHGGTVARHHLRSVLRLRSSITKISPTQFTYQINAIASPPVASATPLAATGGNRS